MEWPLFIEFGIQIHQRFESCFSMRNHKSTDFKKPKSKRRLVVMRPIFAVEFLRKPNDVSELSLAIFNEETRAALTTGTYTFYKSKTKRVYLFQNLAESKRAFIYCPMRFILRFHVTLLNTYSYGWKVRQLRKQRGNEWRF